MSKLNPRIYVACLAAYNNGYLHGEWIDANQDTDDLHAEIKKILASSPFKMQRSGQFMTLKILAIFASMNIPAWKLFQH